MSDEHQSMAMSAAGHACVKTPVLDELAGRGLTFTDAYTPCPICVPARAAFAAGQHVHKTRLWDNAMPYTGTPRGWGHVLQDGGVPVESIGKLHYRADEDPAGFDVEHIAMHVVGGVGMVWASIREEERRLTPPSRMVGEYIGPGESAYTTYDASVVKRTRLWFEERAQSGDTRPWCLFVGLVAPHFPFVVPQEYYDLYPVESLPPVKLARGSGYEQHPWVERQNSFMDTEANFRDAAERQAAIRAYFGLCSWLDANIGEILGGLEAAGFGEDTTVIYTSDHGDNLGARGLWGKSCLYQESVKVPLIMAGPGVRSGSCDTPVSLLDVSATIPVHFGLSFDGDGKSLYEIADAPTARDRAILSQYHAAGAVSGAFMLRKGRWKLNRYIGFPSELFDLEDDPEELNDLGRDPDFATVVSAMQAELDSLIDVDAANAQAFADQEAMIASYGGIEAAAKLGAPGATPPPKTEDA